MAKKSIDDKTLLYVNATITTGLFILLSLTLQPYVNTILNTNSTDIEDTNSTDIERFKNNISNNSILRSINTILGGITLFILSSLIIVINSMGFSPFKTVFFYVTARLFTIIGFIYLFYSHGNTYTLYYHHYNRNHCRSYYHFHYSY